MKNKEILDLSKNGTTIAIQSMVSGDPDMNEMSVQRMMDRLKAMEKKLKKSKRDNEKLEEFYESEVKLPSKKNEKPHLIKSDSCESCQVLRQTNKDLANENLELKTVEKRLNNENKVLKSKVIAYCPKRTNQALKRKNKTIASLSKSLKELKNKQAKHVGEELKQVKRQQISNAYYWRRTCLVTGQLRVKLNQLEKEIATLRSQNKELEGSLTQIDIEETPVIETKRDHKTYDASIRKSVYYCIQSQVPIERVSSVIAYITKEMTGKELSDVPSVSCIRRMTREMGVISDIQGGQALLSSTNSTLSWDGTSLKGIHLNEIHVSTEKENVVLGVSNLPGGTTEGYSKDILQTVSNLMENYSSFERVDEKEMVRQVKGNISNTLTDRVAVNHCVVRELEKDFNKPINELNCNVHPIDGISNNVNKLLRKQEQDKKISGKLFGKGPAGINIVHAVSKMKHKQGTGDPSSFNIYMKMNNISPELLPRFVGNRFHIPFKLAGSIFYLNENIIEYLEKWCPCSSTLVTALQQDLRSKEGQTQLQALGILGKLLTGPWMTNVYSNEENVSHLGMSVHFKSVVSMLKKFKEEPEKVLTTTRDTFGKDLEVQNDDVLGSLLAGKYRNCSDPNILVFLPTPKISFAT